MLLEFGLRLGVVLLLLLLDVHVFNRWVKLLIADVVQFFEHVDKHRSFSFDACFVTVPSENKVYFAISAFLFSFNLSVEWVFNVKLIKVFIADLTWNLRNVRRLSVSYVVPVEPVEEWMILYFFNAVPAQPLVCIANHPSENISRSRRQFGFRRDTESLLPVHNFLTSDRRLFAEEWRISY